MPSDPVARTGTKNVASPLAFAWPLVLVGGLVAVNCLPTLLLLSGGRSSPPAPAAPAVVQVPPEVFERFQSELGAVRAAIPAAVKAEWDRFPRSEKPAELREELKSLQGTLAGVQSAVHESKKATEALSEQWKTALDKLKAASTPPTPAATPPKAIVAEDIVIAVLHSGRVSYKRDLRQALTTLFRDRKAPAEQRLALAVLVGNAFDKPMVDWTDKPEKVDFTNDLDNDNQLPEELNETVLGHLMQLLAKVPGKAGRGRVVVVASGRSRPPELESEAWKKFREKAVRLDVLLLHEAEAKLGEPVRSGNAWIQASGQTGGVVSFVVRSKKIEETQKEVLTRLREWLRPHER